MLTCRLKENDRISVLQGAYVQVDGKAGVCCKAEGQLYGYELKDTTQGCSKTQLVAGVTFKVWF